MPDRHVLPADDGWKVEKDHAQRPSATAATQAEAVKRATEIVANDGGGQVVVHGTDGAVRKTADVPAGDERTGRTAATAAAESTVRGAAATTRAAADDATQTAEAIADDAAVTARKADAETRTGARKAAATAEAGADAVGHEAAAVLEGDKSARAAAGDAAAITDVTAREAGEQVERTGRQVAGEVGAATRRSGRHLAEAASRAEKALSEGADRAAIAGAGIGDEAQDASHRAARSIHTTTEAVAAPLDWVTGQLLSGAGHLAHALNPVRVAGRTVGVAVAAALRATGVVAARGTRVVADTTERVTEASTV